MNNPLTEKTGKYFLIICLLSIVLCTLFCGAQNSVEQAHNFGSVINTDSEAPLQPEVPLYLSIEHGSVFLSVSEVKDLRDVIKKITDGKGTIRGMSSVPILFAILIFLNFFKLPALPRALFTEKGRNGSGAIICYIHRQDGKK